MQIPGVPRLPAATARRRQRGRRAAVQALSLEPRLLLSGVAPGVVATSLAWQGEGSAVSSNSGSTILNGRDLNALVGASRFYEAGFTGTRAIVGNVEAGRIWNGHESLSHVAGYVQETSFPGPQTGDFDRHATWVGMLLAGKPTAPGRVWQSGMAPDATLYSGSLATSWTASGPYTTAFNFDNATFLTPYRQLIVTGTGPAQHTADVINSSWNSADYTASASGLFSRAVDAMVNSASTTVVFSAGNTGPGPNAVGGPAAGYNVLTVGALTSDTDAQPYQSVAAISSRGLNDIFVPSIRVPTNINDPSQGTLIPAARTVVDLVAPGTGITSALYTGTTGGNAGGNDPTPGRTDAYTGNLNGSSFASPLVAGGAALMVDAAKSTFGSETSAVDGRVLKSILQTSADKIPGWSNAQVHSGSAITTTQSLDPASGAGRLNLSTAYDVLLSGTADLPGTGGGPVETRGWDLGTVSAGTTTDYPIQNVLPAGQTLTATLNWYVDRVLTADMQTEEASFDNLDLEIWQTQNGVAVQKIAESRSLYNTVEHLHLTIPETGTYMLRVRWSGEIWDLINDANTETFALSWNTTGLVEQGIPVAAASAPDVFLKGSAQQLIEVRFYDDTAIQTQSITASSIRVIGPDQTSYPVSLKSVSTSENSPIVTARFELSAPGGAWDSTDDGSYRIQILADHVFDDTGHAIPAGIIGNFQVQIVNRAGPDAFGYVAVPKTFTFSDIRTTGTPVLRNLDDGTAELSDEVLQDFEFTFYGTTYRSIFVSTNGLVTLDSPVSAAANGRLEDGPVQPAVAVLWDDLSTYGSQAAVYWKLEGSGLSQRLILQWDRVEFLNGTGEITFQLILNMSDNSLLMSYLDLDGGMPAHNEGRSATTGIRSGSQSGSSALMTSFDGSSQVFVGTERSVLYFDPRPAAPGILTPAGDLPTHRPQFSWTAPAQAARYELWVNRVTAPASVIIHERLNTTTWTSPGSLDMGTYRVWVRAFSEQGDASAWSAPVTFRITVPPLMTKPARLQTTTRPTLSWQPVAGAASYEVWINNQSTGQKAVLRQGDVLTTSFTPSADLPFGDYRIWVRARDAGGFPGAWSTPQDFAVAVWPTLLSPAGTTLDHQPSFTWGALPGALNYQITIRNVLTGQIAVNQVQGGASFKPAAPLPTGVYEWWVRGLAGNHLAGWWSFPGRVSIAGSPRMNPPAQQNAAATPTFSWQSVDQATKYTLFLRQMTGAGKVITVEDIAATSYRPQQQLASGQYRVWVRAIAATGEATWWSRPVDFTIATEATRGEDHFSAAPPRTLQLTALRSGIDSPLNADIRPASAGEFPTTKTTRSARQLAVSDAPGRLANRQRDSEPYDLNGPLTGSEAMAGSETPREVTVPGSRPADMFAADLVVAVLDTLFVGTAGSPQADW